MFNFFKKKQDNPVSEMFHDLTKEQKRSIIDLLFTIAVCDGDEGDSDKELRYLNTYVDLLGVGGDKSMSFLKPEGRQRMLANLILLKKNQKELLAVAAFEMITCDGKPNEMELRVATQMFEKIGVSEDEFVGIIKKTYALMNHINNR